MNKGKKRPVLKELKANEPFPKDFWNYNINPITGYYVEPNRDSRNKEVSNKYAITPQKSYWLIFNTA